MRILSKYKDYYDGTTMYGVDPMIVYSRKTWILDAIDKFDKYLRFITRSYLRSHIRWSHKKYKRVEPFVIGFCGKAYIGWKLHIKDKIDEFDITYDADKAYNLINNDNGWYYAEKMFKNTISDMLNDVSLDDFIEVDAPVFVADISEYRDKIIVNPKLKDYSFQKVMDPYTAFQEISMFLAGTLNVTSREIVEIPEKYRQQQSGMDKWSFRNPDPPKRKQKKKK